MAKPKRGGGRPPKRVKKAEDAVRKDDVFEAEDSDPEEDKHGERYDVRPRGRRGGVVGGLGGRMYMPDTAHAPACVGMGDRRRCCQPPPAASRAAAAAGWLADVPVAAAAKPPLSSSPLFLALQRVDNYEYEMPSDFEDEDIDDEMAFTGGCGEQASKGGL